MNVRPKLLWTVFIALVCVGGFAWFWYEMPKETPQAEKAVEGGNVAPSGKFTPNSTAECNGPVSKEELKNAAQGYIRESGPDELQIGLVRLNKRKRTISFPAKVAEKERPLEYALVHETGKTHEALLCTAAAIQDVHVAALLLDANGQSPKIEVTWRKHGGEAKVPLHEMIGMKDGSLDAVWRYNGSVFIHGGFAASREGSLVALMNDPAALVNHPMAAALMNDDVFFAQSAKLPPDRVQLTVVMTFPCLP